MNTELYYYKSDNLIHQKLNGLCSTHNLAEVFDEMEQFKLGIARMYEMLAEEDGFDVRAFRN